MYISYTHRQNEMKEINKYEKIIYNLHQTSEPQTTNNQQHQQHQQQQNKEIYYNKIILYLLFVVFD